MFRHFVGYVVKDVAVKKKKKEREREEKREREEENRPMEKGDM